MVRFGPGLNGLLSLWPIAPFLGLVSDHWTETIARIRLSIPPPWICASREEQQFAVREFLVTGRPRGGDIARLLFPSTRQELELDWDSGGAATEGFPWSSAESHLYGSTASINISGPTGDPIVGSTLARPVGFAVGRS